MNFASLYCFSVFKYKIQPKIENKKATRRTPIRRYRFAADREREPLDLKEKERSISIHLSDVDGRRRCAGIAPTAAVPWPVSRSTAKGRGAERESITKRCRVTRRS